MFFSLKILVLFFWFCFAYNVLFPLPAPITSVVAWSGIILAIVHTIEFVIKKAALDEVKAGGIHGFCQTLLFGIVYWLPLLKAK